ncbi:cleavage stimulation factor subunit 1-like [Oscarella lobularis]|uniref:cleavage stimulation factor subunit 1-like n=1 Tax=Oscarella lobularis TaxID=121494 RepID=UPI003314040D
MSSSAAVKERELLYKLIISQLRYDGFETVATNLAKSIAGSLAACSSSSRLAHLVDLGLKTDEEQQPTSLGFFPKAMPTNLDLEYGRDDVPSTCPTACDYDTVCVIPHKGQCTAAAFSPDGQLAATGSYDTSVKIVDVERIVTKSDQNAIHEIYPTIRTLYDHTEAVTCIEFHPLAPILATGGDDCKVKFFEFSKPSTKRAFKSITEVVPVRCMAFHPTGDYLLVGTEHPTIRLYDFNTLTCYVSANPKDQHSGPITSIRYSSNGKMYVSSSKDGTIKLWDSVSNRCVNTYPNAHSNMEVSSVTFSRNGKYCLSSGKDSIVNLWDISGGRIINTYKGAVQSHVRSQAVFNHTEDYVLMPDEKTVTVYCWNARTAESTRPLSTAHSTAIGYLAHAPNVPAFITCSEDYRARFWYSVRSNH